MEIHEVTPSLRQLARDMVETMYAAQGIGLAAQQVGHVLQLTVLDVRASDRPSQLILGGREVPLEEHMPMVLLNPKITRQEGEEIGQEGCLSFPKIYADIPRASSIHVSALTLDMHPLQFVATGLLSRAIQHETDHLHGVLFIDRALEKERVQLGAAVKKIERETRATLRKKT